MGKIIEIRDYIVRKSLEKALKGIKPSSTEPCKIIEFPKKERRDE